MPAKYGVSGIALEPLKYKHRSIKASMLQRTSTYNKQAWNLRDMSMCGGCGIWFAWARVDFLVQVSGMNYLSGNLRSRPGALQSGISVCTNITWITSRTYRNTKCLYQQVIRQWRTTKTYTTWNIQWTRRNPNWMGFSSEETYVKRLKHKTGGQRWAARQG